MWDVHGREVMSLLGDEIAAYDRLRADLEAEHFGRWVVFKGHELISTFESFDAAATEALNRFGDGPYLIRQVGAAPIRLPTAIMLRPARASDASWI